MASVPLESSHRLNPCLRVLLSMIMYSNFPRSVLGLTKAPSSITTNADQVQKDKAKKLGGTGRWNIKWSYAQKSCQAMDQQLFYFPFIWLLLENFPLSLLIPGTVCGPPRRPGFTVSWDNVQTEVKAQHPSLKHQNHSRLWTMAFATENSVFSLPSLCCKQRLWRHENEPGVWTTALLRATIFSTEMSPFLQKFSNSRQQIFKWNLQQKLSVTNLILSFSKCEG